MRYVVGARDVRRRCARIRQAEVLCEESRCRVALDASHKRLSGVSRVDIAVDDFELQVRITLKQIYLVIHVRGGPTASIQDRAPFNVEDTATHRSFHRSEDSTAGAVVTAPITRSVIGALVCPHWEDGVVVRP